MRDTKTADILLEYGSWEWAARTHHVPLDDFLVFLRQAKVKNKRE